MYQLNNFSDLQMFSLREEEQQKESWSILHVEVPRDTVAYLIGKNGVNIKLIEEKSGTSVFFIDEGKYFLYKCFFSLTI